MRLKWLRNLSALIGVFALAISAAMLIGRAQPLPEQVALLHLGDMCALPCWIGITPGVTTFQQARALVLSVFNAQNGYVIVDQDSLFDITRTGDTHWTLRVTFVYGQQISTTNYDSLITYIGLQSSADVRLGDLVNRSGMPTEAAVFYDIVGSVFQRVYRQTGTRYTAVSLPASLTNEAFNMWRPVYSLSMWDQSLDKFMSTHISQWRGFGLYNVSGDSR